MRARTVVVISVAVVLVVAVWGLVFPDKTVMVSYVGGEQCATADQDPAEIHRATFFNQLTKKTKIRWEIKGGNQEEFDWTFAFKGTGESLLGGPYSIPGNKKKSKKTKHSQTAGNWTYRIVVDDPEADGSCQSDPIIIIKR